MEIELIWKITGLGHLLIACLLSPALMIYLKTRNTNRQQKWTTPLLTSVFTTWIIRNAYRLTIEVPINIQRARSVGDEMYDGVGGNVVTLFGTTGFLVGIFILAFHDGSTTQTLFRAIPPGSIEDRLG